MAHSEWIYFHILVFICLFIDLRMGHSPKKVEKVEPSLKKALLWSAFWIVLALIFGLYVYHTRGEASAIEYYTAYLVEKSLSVDNLFVFAIIFKSFQVNSQDQHRLLYWGVVGALVMRAIMITVGVSLVQAFHPIIYVFGAFLLWTGIKIIKESREDDEPKDFSKGALYRFFSQIFPFSPEKRHDVFMVKDENGKRLFTQGFLALLVIESSDLIFAVDSIPAVIGLSRDSFVIYTSNVCAILGLRALYFVLSDFLKRFHLLPLGLGVILVFIGCKMLVESWIKLAPTTNLIVIASILLGSIVLSLVTPKRL